MSKKKFTDGLESLFSLSVEENEKEEVLLVVEAEEKQEKTQTEKKKTKRKASKSFAADLDFLFSGTSAYQEEEKEEEKPSTKKEKAGKKNDGPKVFSGLEALLRNTIDTSRYNQVEPSKMKRVTFTFDKEKLVRLKKIAKEQKAYLKDIIGKVVSEYIEEYDKDPDKVVTE